MSTGRMIIGFRHRRKQKAGGEPSLSQIYTYYPATQAAKAGKLATEQDELDFLRGLDPALTTIVMTLGGSGDPFVYAAANLKIPVLRIPPFYLKAHRDEQAGEKDDDSALLVRLAQDQADLFYPVTTHDLKFIQVREAHRSLDEAMKARIAAEQRLAGRVIGSVFMAAGVAPEQKIIDQIDETKANDRVIQALVVEEKERESALKKALRQLDVYTEIFEPIEGIGVRLAGRMIAGIIDIRRFPTEAAFRAYCGVHLIASEKGEFEFARRKAGRLSNWSNDLRTALYLCGDQFNRRPNSEWGQRMRRYKEAYRTKHPVPVEVEVGTKTKKLYTDGHIHRMAIWKACNRFATHIYRKWWQLEERRERGILAQVG